MIRRPGRDREMALDGRSVASTSPLHDVATFLDDMRLEAAAMRAPTPSPALAAIFDGRRTLPRAPSVRPARPSAAVRLRPVAALVAATAVTFGGLATAGALPGPIQRVSADLVTHLGIRLPGTPQPTPAPTPTTPTPNGTPSSRSTTAPSTTTARTATTTTTTAPPDNRAEPALPTTTPTPGVPIPLPVPDRRAPIGPTGIRLPIELLPRPTFRR